jgi:phosphotransferase system enzyme I (PtsI)
VYRAGAPAITKNGRRIDIAANIGSFEDVKIALSNGAEGVGLFRTEFLFISREKPPTEEERYEACSEVVGAMAGHPVIIRTLDIVGIKRADGRGDI